MRRGVHRPLEDQADELIRQSIKGITKHSAKSDILTPWKQADRYRREVYVSSGVPEKSLRQGMFHRAVNSLKPELNSRDGISRPRRGVSNTLSDFVGLYSVED